MQKDWWEREREGERESVSAGCRGLSIDSCFVVFFLHNKSQEEIDEPLRPVTSPKSKSKK